MKRSIDRVAGAAAAAATAADSEQVVVHPHKRRAVYDFSNNVDSRSASPAPLPSPEAEAFPLLASALQPLQIQIEPQQRRGDCDLHVHLKEEGLIRHIFTYLDVREHQLVRSCSRGWKQLVRTLDLDRLDVSHASPLTPATIDRAFVSVIHNYNRVLHLDLSGQRALADRDLLVLASCFWANLEHISVNDCLDVTDFGLLSVLNAQSLKLQRISMRHCKRISGNFARAQITGRHPALKTLDLYDTRVGLRFVCDVNDAFPSLERIDAMHTPAHLELFEQHKWLDLVNDLAFIVSNELVDLPHLQGLLAEFMFRSKAVLATVNSYRASSDAAGARASSVFLRTLLKEGKRAMLNVPLQRGAWTSALLTACEHKRMQIIQALIASGSADVDVTDKDSASPLCVAATNGLSNAVQLLLRAGADINKRTYCLATPLYIASETDGDAIVEMLLQRGAQTDCAIVGGATALCVAAKNGNRSIVARLLDADTCRVCATSPLRNAQVPQRDQLQFVQALFLACERGHTDVVADILDRRGLSVNVLMDSDVTPLYLACQMGHIGIVDLLLQRGANPNFRRPSGGVSCLYIAAQEGKHRIVERLVRHNVNVHARMEDLSTALHIAARMGHLKSTRVLLRNGACIDDQTRSGLTPLYIACEEGHADVVQFLIECGAHLDISTKNGTTPLFVASQKGHVAAVQALLVAGANVHLTKANGTCPMDAASLLGNYEVTQLLLQFGARVGGLALHFAERRRDLRLQALLMDRYYAQHVEQQQQQAMLFAPSQF